MGLASNDTDRSKVAGHGKSISSTSRSASAGAVAVVLDNGDASELLPNKVVTSLASTSGDVVDDMVLFGRLCF
jgi:hypothetical protein